MQTNTAAVKDAKVKNSMKVKAAVVNGVNEKYEMEELTLSELRADEVLVKVVATGICHSDEALRIGDAEYPMPAVFGHEGAGIIEKVGSAVKDLAVGDQVVMAYDYCGTCPSCRTGHPSSCKDWTPINFGSPRSDGTYIFTKADGTPVSNFFNQSSFSTYTITYANNLIKVDPETDLRLVGPLGCGLLTGFGTIVNGLKPETNSSIAIFGTGAVGLGALMTAKIEGCSPIIAIDIHDSRLERAKELGATHTINSRVENLEERIAEITGGIGVNYSIDTTGISSVMKSSLDILTIGGSTVPLAVTPNSLEFNPFTELTLNNRKVVGVLMGDAVPQLAIPKLIQYHKEGKFPFDKLVKFYKFDEINEASEDSNSGKTIKPILIIDEDYRKDEPVMEG
ncbi:Zn-dependent alcohol dehydrogenases, class III [Bacillus sp. OxB-1]|uniref:NAD(P)-dependent alcohol dehydrogenase n=1 Tax=Bacillus sp. (strain OxB-1) TaxID=98228 RepID=UPI0005821752|nr:NAD(P)-dependent alcohol dehydrogenase [Bacillus sp. OxB-1]BAQ08925.1 Zn-dependent alcohol dehydrogenases, class III [Bacillus sp. OxB-1]